MSFREADSVRGNNRTILWVSYFADRSAFRTVSELSGFILLDREFAEENMYRCLFVSSPCWTFLPRSVALSIKFYVCSIAPRYPNLFAFVFKIARKN